MLSGSILGTLLVTVGALAGTYTTTDCSIEEDCTPVVPASVTDPVNDTTRVPPRAVVHPLGYDGSGGTIQLNVCLAIGDEEFGGALSRAIATWNALVPTVDNCLGTGCKVWEEIAQPPPASPETEGPLLPHAESILLHELGHCAFGLDHPDRNWDAQATPDGFWEFTSFTRSWAVRSPPNGIQLGSMTDVPGSKDNIQMGLPGKGDPNSVSWFRMSDNNPFAIDGTVIDIDTLGRVFSDLPVGSSWMASGNRRVAEQLGLGPTQAVMYGLVQPGEIKKTLTSDDVNMVKMGMTGMDLRVGGGDDYTVELVESCEEPVAIFVDRTATQFPTSAGECESLVDFSFPQNPLLARHFSLVPPPKSGGFLTITLNQDLTWDVGSTPDLVLTMTDGDIVVNPGGTVAYIVIVGNQGQEEPTSPAEIVTMVPQNTIFDVAQSSVEWSCTNTTAGSPCTASIASLPVGGTPVFFTFAVIVDDPVASGVTEISIEASVSASGGDGDPSNNMAIEATPVELLPEIFDDGFESGDTSGWDMTIP